MVHSFLVSNIQQNIDPSCSFITELNKKERPFRKKIQVALLEVSSTTTSNQKGITRESEGGVFGRQHEGHAAVGMSWSGPRFLGSFHPTELQYHELSPNLKNPQVTHFPHVPHVHQNSPF